MAGPLGGAADISDSGHHRSWRRRWRAPWEVLPVSPAAGTTKVGDIDGGPPRGCCRYFGQRPPPKLETLMATAATLIITCLGQFSASLVGEVNKALVRGVHYPGPQTPIR
jgi:hypothetical protein